jgi:phospholipid/cholesterol/gamma-HCH transport system ATP-binding protein
MAAVIEARGIVNRFGRQVVHDGLDMEVEQGEVFGIVGGSGSGKSVLLRTLLGLQKPVRGTVHIEGREVTHRGERELLEVKRRYGVMFQRGALFSSLTVAQNVELPIREHFPMPEPVLRELALLRLQMVGLAGDDGAKFPAQLSGGMTKRAALARALALDPAILFLDEPTSGLDPISTGKVEAALQELKQEYTIILVPHSVQQAGRTADYAAFFLQGELVEYGEGKSLFTAPREKRTEDYVTGRFG